MYDERIVAVDAAFRATDMAMDDICIENIHGINGRTPEATMKYMGMIGIPRNDRDGKDDRRDYGNEKVKKIEQHREGSNPE